MTKKKTTSVALVVQQPKKQQQKKKKKNKNKPKPSRIGTSMHSLQAAVCSVTDPFCDHAKGGRWTDETNVPSLPYQVRAMLTVATDANGSACVAILPDLVGGWSTTNTITGTTAAFTGDFTPLDGTIVPSQYRLVSGGWKFISTVAPMYAQGEIAGIEFSGGHVDLTAVAINPFKVPARYSQPLADRKPVHYVYRPAGPDARKFQQYAAGPTPINAGTSNDWTWSICSIYGGPVSTTVGYIEMTFNFEFLFEENSAYNSFLSKPPGSNPLISTASSHVQSSRPPFISGSTDAVSNKLALLANKALAGAAPMLKQAVVSGVSAYAGPLAGRLTDSALGAL